MPESLNALGFMYYKGYGVEKNITEAEKYFQIAAKDGSKDGYYNLGLIAYSTFPAMHVDCHTSVLTLSANTSTIVCLIG